MPTSSSEVSVGLSLTICNGGPMQDSAVRAMCLLRGLYLVVNRYVWSRTSQSSNWINVLACANSAGEGGSCINYRSDSKFGWPGSWIGWGFTYSNAEEDATVDFLRHTYKEESNMNRSCLFLIVPRPRRLLAGLKLTMITSPFWPVQFTGSEMCPKLCGDNQQIHTPLPHGAPRGHLSLIIARS